jgi:hypothetical protein
MERYSSIALSQSKEPQDLRQKAQYFVEGIDDDSKVSELV